MRTNGDVGGLTWAPRTGPVRIEGMLGEWIWDGEKNRG